MTVSYRAAYVPEQEFRDWEDATQLAVAHVEDECAEHGMSGLLVTTHSVSGGGYTSHLERFVARHRNHTTPRSRNRRAHLGQRPTLVYVTGEELLGLASDYARGWALCAVESFNLRLDGWAAATGAVNLDTGEVAPPVSDDVADLLDRLAFYGNNGWGDPFGKQMAGHVLSDLRGAGLDADFIAGYMIAKNRSHRGVKRLRALIDKVAWRIVGSVDRRPLRRVVQAPPGPGPPSRCRVHHTLRLPWPLVLDTRAAARRRGGRPATPDDQHPLMTIHAAARALGYSDMTIRRRIEARGSPAAEIVDIARRAAR